MLQYGEIFSITAVVCVVGAVLGLLIAARGEFDDESHLEDSQPQQRSSPGAMS